MTEVGRSAITTDSVEALDTRARNDIERLTTDLARQVASFLHDRDEDIRLVSRLEPGRSRLSTLESRYRPVIDHGAWHLDADGKTWQPAKRPATDAELSPWRPGQRPRLPLPYPGPLRPLRKKTALPRNELSCRPRRKRSRQNHQHESPLPRRANIADRRNTFVKAETYFPELKNF